MFGLSILVLFVGYSVWRYDANALMVIGQHADTLYGWYFWTTILSQAFFFITTWICFIIAIKSDKSKGDYAYKLWTFFLFGGIFNLVISALNIFAALLLMKLLKDKPTEFSQLSPNLVFTISALYLTSAYRSLIMMFVKKPEKE